MAETKRVLTGIRPTGKLHLGHYVGALKLWIDAQNEGYDCFFLLADIQALTTHADKPELIESSIREVVLDWISVGLDPKLPNVHFVLQSGVKSRFEMSQYLLLISHLGEIQRNPTIKDEIKSQKNPSMGFMTYPVDQAADILMISPEMAEGNKLLVPVGADQVPHLEYSRELARRFNNMYNDNILMPCEAKVGKVGRLVGIDGNDKMSKSKGNAIYLSDSAEEVEKKVMSMYTDPSRVHPTDPGKVEGNPLFIYFDAFADDKGEIEEYKRQYRNGEVGDVKLKKRLAEVINSFLWPIRERRAEALNMDLKQIVVEGTAEAERLAGGIVWKMKKAMYLWQV